jgi:hypothetical protein
VPGTGPPRLDTLERALSVTSAFGDWRISLARQAAAPEYRCRWVYQQLRAHAWGALTFALHSCSKQFLRVHGLLPGSSQAALGTGWKLSLQAQTPAL